LSRCYRNTQTKSENLARNAGKIGLIINPNKTKALKNNSQTADPIEIREHIIEEVTEFAYLKLKQGSVRP